MILNIHITNYILLYNECIVWNMWFICVGILFIFEYLIFDLICFECWICLFFFSYSNIFGLTLYFSGLRSILYIVFTIIAWLFIYFFFILLCCVYFFGLKSFLLRLCLIAFLISPHKVFQMRNIYFLLLLL